MRTRFLITKNADASNQSNIIEKYACWNLEIYHKYEKRIFFHQVKYMIWKLIVMTSRKQM